ncbi:twin-arginine translocase TatA/TatE family subunit [Pseudomonas sp. NyZ704]|nr:twin-arginine translocase TatA/TatE family subunit [Pseudomonas sp. NyZ704]
MFDNGLSEWVLVLTVALLVLGPQRALAITKVAGAMLGKAKAALADVQAQVEKELPREELQELKDNVIALKRSNVRRKVQEVLASEEKKA